MIGKFFFLIRKNFVGITLTTGGERSQTRCWNDVLSVDSRRTTIFTLLPPSHIVAQVETEAMIYGFLSDDGVISTTYTL